MGWSRAFRREGPAKAATPTPLRTSDKALARRHMQIHRWMHRVKPPALAIVNDDAARFVLADGLQGIAGVLLPMNEVGGRGDRRAPQSRLRTRLGAAMIIGVVAALVLDDLIQRDQILVI